MSPCYVDPLRPTESRIGWRYQDACHLLCDTHDELLAMAAQIRLKPAWIQKEGTAMEHFDLTKERRKWAVAMGAEEVTSHRMAEIMRDKMQKREVARG